MDFFSIIQKKKLGLPWTREEIAFWVNGAAQKTIPDYQLAALLMAVCLRGMTDEETAELTMAMAQSGSMVDLSAIEGGCVDKHSTGGVGDTATLVLVPLVAACGGKTAKMSGRGLGHTGGTLDKLESIPGFSTAMDMEHFVRQVQSIGCAVIGQTTELAPADKTLYALRDVTGTVDSIPLIASSVMSKKLAAGCRTIVLDVKTGSGAVMHKLEDSLRLAQTMVRIGTMANRRVCAMVTGMEQPLGTHVGNALEVKEAIDILAGRTKGRLLEVSLRLGACMLTQSGVEKSEEQARRALERALSEGRGLECFARMIAGQGGDFLVTEHTERLPQAKSLMEVCALQDGYVNAMDTEQLGFASLALGAGRKAKDDAIDPAVGFVMKTELGAYVRKGEPIAIIHTNGRGTEEACRKILEAVKIEDTVKPVPPLVYARVTYDKTERYN